MGEKTFNQKLVEAWNAVSEAIRALEVTDLSFTNTNGSRVIDRNEFVQTMKNLLFWKYCLNILSREKERYHDED